MTLSYEDALRWLYGLAPRGIRLELDRMHIALERVGNPQKGLKFVHIAGTNGKGSVAALVERTLRAAGYKTGLYTSPHLHRFTERIQINGAAAEEKWIAERVEALQIRSQAFDAPELTFFEATTLIAFETFAKAQCEIVILEVGLGGRLDATNVVRSDVCAITSIDFDHMQYLGDTLAQIATEKAGIMQRGVPCVLGPIRGEALQSIERVARDVDAPLVHATVGEHVPRSALRGSHQRDNEAVAHAVLLEMRKLDYRIDDEVIAYAFERVRWPGRLELVDHTPSFLFDAAHNDAGVATLAAHLRDDIAQRPRVLVFAAMQDKPVEAMLAALRPYADYVITTRPDTHRAADSSRYPADCAHVESVRDAMDQAIALAGERGLVIVAGSIYLLAQARAHALGLQSDPPIGM